MKNILFIFAITLSLAASAQYDTLVSISAYGGYARKAAPGAMTIDRDSKRISLAVHVIPVDSAGHEINNLLTHPYVVTISTDGICVNGQTGQEIKCPVVLPSDTVPQWNFLRKLSLLQISEYSEEIQYIHIADSNGTFNNQ